MKSTIPLNLVIFALFGLISATEVALEDEIEALRRIANVPKEGSASAMDDEPDESPTVMDTRSGDVENELPEDDEEMQEREALAEGVDEPDEQDDSEDESAEDDKEMVKRGGYAKVWMRNANNRWRWRRVERVLPTRGEINSLTRNNGGLVYISGSRTYDNVRQKGKGPYNVWFTDRRNNQWYVRIPRGGSGTTFMIPAGSEIYWKGPNDRVRTGSGAHTSWAEVNFSYLKGGWGRRSGIRIRFQGYRYGNSREDHSVTQMVDDVFKYVGKGVDIANKISKIVARHSKGRG